MNRRGPGRGALLSRIALAAALSSAAVAAPAATVHCGGAPLAAEGVPLPVRAAFEPDRWRHLPQTARRLFAGEDLQVVQLGDSIVGNTFGPQFGASGHHSSTAWGLDPVAAEFGGRIWSVVSVRGSTGVWFYRDPAELESQVRRYAPDLVMIGGISNRGDIDAMRDVIAQIRADLPAAEIVLMTGAVNLQSMPSAPSFEAGPAAGSWEAALRDLSRELGTGYIDLRTSYDDFVVRAHDLDPALDHAYFQSDPIHANDRGRALLREIVTTFFRATRPCEDGIAPPRPAPDPAPLALATLVRRTAPVGGVAAGDLDGDGADDLVVLGDAAPADVHLGPLDGADPDRVPARQIAGGPYALAYLVDLNGDGTLDLAGVDAARQPAAALARPWPQGLGPDAEIVAMPAAVALTALVTVQADGDPRPDLAGLRADGAGIRIWLNRSAGAGAFQAEDLPFTAADGLPLGLAAIDVDRDGRDDLITLRSEDAGTASLIVDLQAETGFPASAGRWRIPLNLSAAAAVQALDVDETGAEIAVFGGADEPWVRVYRLEPGNPGAWLEPRVLSKGEPGACAVTATATDLDRDGRRDLLVQDACAGSVGRVAYYQGASDVDSLLLRSPAVFAAAGSVQGLAELAIDRAGRRAIVVGHLRNGAGEVLALSLPAPVPPPPPPPAAAPQGGGGMVALAELSWLLLLAFARAIRRRLAS